MAQLREARPQDEVGIRSLHLAAFPEAEREAIATLSASLLAERTTPETVTLVAEAAGGIVGHVAFSPVAIDGADPDRAYILAPLAVHPTFQKQRLGTRLIEAGLALLEARAVDIVFVYGDPAYYGRFGFDATLAESYEAPYPLAYPFGWQAKLLTDIGVGPSGGTLTCVAALSDPALW